MFCFTATALYSLLGPAPLDAVQPEPAPVVDAAPPVDPVGPDDAELRRRLEALEQADSEAAERDREREAAREAERETLREDNAALHEEVDELQERLDHSEQRLDRADEHLRRQRLLSARLHGYLDVGFFWVGGDGSGIRPDLGNETLGLDGVAPDTWVFMGDPLSTAINSRGDPADTGDSQAIAFDPIRSRGTPTLLVNALNIAPSIGLGERIVVEGMVDFLPRGQTLAPYGDTAVQDYVDIKMAYMRWMPRTKRIGLRLYAGKIDSVFGREYRDQEAPDRLTVTPSLMCRYTCGRPIGLKGRLTFLSRRQLAVNVSLTNGSTMQRSFGTASAREHNWFKTVAARVSYEFDVGTGLEVGASGLVGAQDLQPRNDVVQWQYGVDLHFGHRGFELIAEFIQGEMPGRDAPGQAPCSAAQCLDLLSAYGLVGYRVTNWLMPVLRADWRDSRHHMGGAFYYESDLVRVTPGVRFEVGEHVVLKAEYTFNRELGKIPQFPNDVFTTSAVARF